MNEFEVYWTNIASKDLINIIQYIKVENPTIAKKIFIEIKKECENLKFLPEKFRIVPELQNIGIKKYRELIHQRWRVIYKIDKNNIYILAVIDSSRNFEDILLNRLIQN